MAFKLPGRVLRVSLTRTFRTVGVPIPPPPAVPQLGVPTEGQIVPADFIQFVQLAEAPPPVVEAPESFDELVMAERPVLYYRLTEAPGAAMLLDVSGNGNHGQVSGGVVLGLAGLLVDVPDDKAAGLNGINGRIAVGLGNNLMLQRLTTLAMVECPERGRHLNIFDFDATDAGAVGSGYHFGIDQLGRARFFVGTNAAYQISESDPLAVGQKYFICGTYDGINMAVYVNGAKHDELEISRPVYYPNTKTGLYLGFWSHGGLADIWGKGVFGRPAIIPAALSNATITKLYKAAFNLP